MKIKLNIKIISFSIIALIIIFILIGLIVKNVAVKNFEINTYKDNNITFKYDSNFETNNNNDDYVELNNNDNTATVVIKNLDGNELNADIAKNIAYQVIDKDKYIETYNNYENNRYIYLFENYNQGKQIEVISFIMKKKLYIVIYESNSDSFDLYIESLNIILDSLKVIGD